MRKLAWGREAESYGGITTSTDSLSPSLPPSLPPSVSLCLSVCRLSAPAVVSLPLLSLTHSLSHKDTSTVVCHFVVPACLLESFLQEEL
jgi:hypothetical protein